MNYVRFERGIYELKDDFIILKDQKLYYPHFKSHVVDQSNKLEDLIIDGDMLYIHDLYPDTVLVVEGNIKPFGYQEAIKLKDWLKYKIKFDLYIKQRNGDYILNAKTNDKGNLELLWK